MTRWIAVLVVLVELAVLHGAWPLSAQEPAMGYAAAAAPGPTTLEEAVLAWDAGDAALARLRAREARRAAPTEELPRLVDVAIAMELDPHVVLELDPAARGNAIGELDAIDAQRLTAHIVGIASGVVGILGVLVAVYLPQLIEPGCSIGCSASDPVRFGGGLAGIAALIGGGIGIGMHVDAGGWVHRWADALRVTVGPLSVRPASISLRF